MKGITIYDRDSSNGTLSFDLQDILSTLGEDAVRSTWTLQDVECLGGTAAATLHDACDANVQLAGHRLVELARELTQTIEGVFSGRLPNEEEHWIRIRAVDSSAFDVETTREDALMALRERFTQVEDIP